MKNKIFLSFRAENDADHKNFCQRFQSLEQVIAGIRLDQLEMRAMLKELVTGRKTTTARRACPAGRPSVLQVVKNGGTRL